MVSIWEKIGSCKFPSKARLVRFARTRGRQWGPERGGELSPGAVSPPELGQDHTTVLGRWVEDLPSQRD